jgi:hypothetical protein
MPDNYAGGALGNRYFLNIYPLFLFLPHSKKNYKEIFICWIAAALFISPIVTNAFTHSHYPATHAKKFPYTLFPVEMTLHNNIPTNTNPWAFRQEVGERPNIGWLHFLDDDFLPRYRGLDERGFWTRGSGRADMILKTYYPVKELVFHILNNPRLQNTVTVQVGGKKQKIVLGSKQRGALRFSPKALKIEYWHLYKIKVKAAKGSIPYYEDERALERRYLGAYFEIEIIPEN